MWLECERLARLPWLLHAFSTRHGGVSEAPAAGLNLGLTDGDSRANVQQNRKVFLRALSAGRFSLATLHQVHSSRVYQIARRRNGKLECRISGALPARRSNPARLEGDALVTGEAGVLLSVRSADCMPVLLADRRQRVIAAIHAGWRGALEGIIENAASEMQRRFASRPRDLLAAVGPFIHACCYEVGQEVVEAFRRRFPQGKEFFRNAPPGPAARLDLGAVARDQLRSAGVLCSNIAIAEFCTSCRADLFFSHRRDGGRTGRMMAVLGMRPGQAE